MSTTVSSKNRARFVKIMPGVQQYIEQAGGAGIPIESSAQLFGNPFYVFPPSSLDEKNYDLIPGMRFLCIIATRARTRNNRRYFETPQLIVEWINFIQDVPGTTGVVGDIALEILNAFGEVDEADYIEAKATEMGRTRKFTLAVDEEEDDDPFSNAFDNETDQVAGDTHVIDPAMRATPTVEQAEGNSESPRS